MNWTQLLKSEIERVYATPFELLNRVSPGSWNWKPVGVILV
jgi:hypothetical protein